MNSFEIIKGQGGVPKALPNKDHVSGLVMMIPGFNAADDLTGEAHVYENAIDAVAGLQHDVSKYHVREYFRMQPAGRLWLTTSKASNEAENTAKEMVAAVRRLMDNSNGECRQIAVWNGGRVALPGHLSALQELADEYEGKGTPVSFIYTAMLDDGFSSEEFRSPGRCNVSMVIGEDMSEGSEAEAIRKKDDANIGSKCVSAIGACLGCVSLAAVNESIAWVSKFNLGYSKVGRVGGVVITQADATTLDDAGFLFLVKYDGVAGAYWNDSHTMDVATSDYSTIESMRAIDKACRGVRTYLLPYLASPVYLNDDGTMRADSLANLKNVAGQALEAMERAGELSGYVVEIDAKQNILANSTVEFVIKNVAVGVMRNIKIKIGYTTNI